MKEHHDSHEFEFCGPWGPVLLVFVLPLVCYGLYFGCNAHACLQIMPSLFIPASLPPAAFYSHTAMLVFTSIFCGVLALHIILPGKKVQGVVLPDGSRLTYKLNGRHVDAMISAGILTLDLIHFAESLTLFCLFSVQH